MTKPSARVAGVAGAAGAALVILAGLGGTAIAQAPARNAPPARPTAPAAAPAAAPATAAPSAAPPVRPGEAVRQGSDKGGEVIARVAGRDVTADEIRAVVESLDARQQAALARDPGLLSQTVRSMLANRLVLKEALDKKWEQQPAVAARVERARENAIVESYLQSVTVPPVDFPSEADIKAAYEANASAFLLPRRFQLAQVFVAVEKGADQATEDKARKKLDDVMKKLKAPGADFAAVAKAESDDKESLDKGGEIGWLAEAQLRPEIRGQVVGLAKGAISEPVRLDDGWHVLRLIDTRPSESRPLAEVRDALVQRLREERAEANRRAFVTELLRKSPPAINELALSKLLDGIPAEPR
ncbi:peptidylprolyl isomerase [Rhodoplanes azumiensis]|uniref:Parvulin-like PPIase n=1 Tax=Rhodoplanes azumiensis TaxID=1897628 RepID=A0ABW5AN91_9BRAD